MPNKTIKYLRYSIQFGVASFLVTLLTACSFGSSGSHYTSGECDQVRAAFDLGSEITKMQVARVDACEGIIIQTLIRDEIPVDYQADIEKNGGELSPTIIKQGIDAIKQLKKQSLEYQPAGYFGVATGIFESAGSTGSAVVDELSQKSGISFTIINKQQETDNRYTGALNKAQLESENGVVWEIDNDRQQITTAKGINGQDLFEIPLGSNNFKSLVISVLDKANKKTPNPMTKSEINTAILLAQTRAEKSISQVVKDRIDESDSTVVGIGSVHVFSIPGSLKNQKTYDREMLEDALYAYADMDDKMLGGGLFVSNKLTDMALVLGFMNALNIDEIIARRVDNTEAVLVNQKLWWQQPVKK